MDFYNQLRQRMIDTMQISLRQIRQVLNLGVQEFSDIVGLTRQSINNLETSKIKMSTVQFVAICAVVDHFVETQPELMKVIISILNSNDTLYDSCIFDDLSINSLLKKWFSYFPNDSKVIVPSADIVDDMIENYKIFIDDTALCEISSENQIASLISKMQQATKRFIIPLRVVDSIQSRLLNEEPSYIEIARNGMANLQHFQKLGISEIRGEQSDVTITTTLVSVFVKYKVLYRLALITQNKKLAETILALNTDGIGGFPILVLRFSADGILDKWKLPDNEHFDRTEDGVVVCENQSIIRHVITDSYNKEIISDGMDKTLSRLKGWEFI